MANLAQGWINHLRRPARNDQAFHPDRDARSSLDMSYEARKRRFLPLKINSKPAHALLDSGVIGNAICEDYAKAIGLVIKRPSSKHHFVNAKNEPFESVGTTTFTFSIPADQTSPKSEWTRSFAVVQRLAAPLVLGNQFLQETGALVSFTHLMVRKTLSVMSVKIGQVRKVWRFMHMNLPTQKLSCSLDAKPVCAALDSGSDIDVVSSSYAKFRHWQLKPLPKDEEMVLLANNELVKLAGYVETTLGIRGHCIPRKLYVLDNLVCNVLLGDPTIEALDIFSKFQSSIVNTRAAEGMNRFSIIQVVKEIKKIEDEVDQLLAERRSTASTRTDKHWWMSFLLKGDSQKNSFSDDEGIVEELKKRLERVNVCSANCRRAFEAELMILSGDDHSRKKEEFGKIKTQNDELRDKIRQHIKARSRVQP